MMIRPLPDILSNNLFSRVTSELRTDLDRAALEAVTGRKSDIAAAVAGRVGEVQRAQKALDQAQATKVRLAVVEGRYTTAGASYKTIRESAASAQDDALKAVASNSTTGFRTAANGARNALATTFSALNIRFDGRALFAGNDSAASPLGNADDLITDIQAIVDGAPDNATALAEIDAYFGPGGQFETQIYGGGTGEAAGAVLPDGFVLPSLDRADAEPVRELMKGLAIIATSVKLPPVEIVDWVRQGADILRGGQEDLLINEAVIGDSLNRIDRATEAENDEQLLASTTLDRLIGRDAFEAATDVQNIETRLQAAYTLTSRISRLSLANFLR